MLIFNKLVNNRVAVSSTMGIGDIGTIYNDCDGIRFECLVDEWIIFKLNDVEQLFTYIKSLKAIK